MNYDDDLWCLYSLAKKINNFLENMCGVKINSDISIGNSSSVYGGGYTCGNGTYSNGTYNGSGSRSPPIAYIPTTSSGYAHAGGTDFLSFMYNIENYLEKYMGYKPIDRIDDRSTQHLKNVVCSLEKFVNEYFDTKING